MCRDAHSVALSRKFLYIKCKSSLLDSSYYYYYSYYFMPHSLSFCRHIFPCNFLSSYIALFKLPPLENFIHRTRAMTRWKFTFIFLIAELNTFSYHIITYRTTHTCIIYITMLIVMSSYPLFPLSCSTFLFFAFTIFSPQMLDTHVKGAFNFLTGSRIPALAQDLIQEPSIV